MGLNHFLYLTEKKINISLKRILEERKMLNEEEIKKMYLEIGARWDSNKKFNPSLIRRDVLLKPALTKKVYFIICTDNTSDEKIEEKHYA